MKTIPRLMIAALASVVIVVVPSGAASPGSALSLFDGASLADWRAAENPGSFRVEDGAIVCNGPRAHLFYMGANGDADFDNFELTVEVMTKPGANSGIFFHTRWQEFNWPAEGFEVQVNNSQKQHGDYLEYKMTGSLYGIRNVYRALVPDNEWFTLTVTVQQPRVQVRLNGTLVVDYAEPAAPLPEGAPALNRLGRGTFALQAHDPESTALYRAIRVKRLPPAGTPMTVARPTLDAAAVQRLALGKANFPLVDLHTWLSGNLTLDQALDVSREAGMGLGIVTRLGAENKLANEADVQAYLAAMKSQPVFLGAEVDGTDWQKTVGGAALARFDYLFADATANAASVVEREGLPKNERDVQSFMDRLVEQVVATISTEPIDFLANATFLPESLGHRHEELWTEQRMHEIIGAAVKHRVAIEINSRTRLPPERFVQLAKTSGAKFTIGGDNTSSHDFGDWSYAWELQRKFSLSWKDMWVPGHQLNRAQGKVHPPDHR